ncbi:SgcJ/EcaC family oxidoreductase [Xylophilus sp. Kf1]|nr:SgcJ/EcaC family oxidoreductase [Xylophilus sp. Kf1]
MQGPRVTACVVEPCRNHPRHRFHPHQDINMPSRHPDEHRAITRTATLLLALLGTAAVVGCAASACATARASAGARRDEAGVRRVVEARRLAWNAQDLPGYRRLLTPDAELTSATGKTAHGREEILRLYVDQRKGVYRDAALPSTVVDRIRFITDDVAMVDAAFVLTGVRTEAGAPLPPVEGINSYLLVRRTDGWVIAAMRGVPHRPIAR